MPKKVIETHGKIEGKVPTRLEQLFGGYNDLSRYGTLDESDYVAQVNNMTRIDLEHQAKKHGIVIVESTARLRELLIKEFRKYVSSLYKPESKTTHPQKIDPEVQRILNIGR